MMQTVDAVFENGVLRPLSELPLTHGQQVRITVEPKTQRPIPSVDQTARVLELARKVYEGLTAEEIDEIEKAIQRRPFRELPSRDGLPSAG